MKVRLAHMTGAVFTGLALANSGVSNFPCAAESRNGRIHVFDDAFNNATNATFAGFLTH